MALSAEEYTIQTISALKESSITPAFEKKIKKTGLPYIKKVEGDRHVVLVGSYKKKGDTKPDVKKVRSGVVHDAFVRPMDRTHAPAAVVSEKEKTVHPDAANPNVKAVAAVAAASQDAQAKAAVVAVQKKEELPVTQPASVAAAKTAPAQVVVVYDRNAVRKCDISEAIEYYKHSPYHTFQPVALQR